MGIFGRSKTSQPVADVRRSAGAGRGFDTTLTVGACLTLLDDIIGQYWTAKYPDQPASTSAGFVWLPTERRAPDTVMNFDVADGNPALMALWDLGERRRVALFVPVSDQSSRIEAGLVVSWRAADSSVREAEGVSDGDLRYVAPTVPADLPWCILDWSGLPRTESNYTAATGQLTYLLSIKLDEVERLPGSEIQRGQYVGSPGSVARCQEVMDRMVATRPASVPFVQQLPWRIAALLAESLRENVREGNLAPQFQL